MSFEVTNNYIYQYGAWSAVKHKNSTFTEAGEALHILLKIGLSGCTCLVDNSDVIGFNHFTKYCLHSRCTVHH